MKRLTTLEAHIEGNMPLSSCRYNRALSNRNIKVSDRPETFMSKYRVLIVEEDTDIIELLRLFLEQQGYEVILETQGVKALETCAAQRPDILLADIDLHGTSSFTIYTKLRADPETANLPVALLVQQAIPFGFPSMAKPEGIFFAPFDLRSLSSYIAEKCQSQHHSSNSVHHETSMPRP